MDTRVKSTIIQLLPWLAIILMVFVSYSRAIGNGEVWDDSVYLTAWNFTDIDGLKRIWLEPTSTRHPYYPMTRTLFWLEHQISGRDLRVHHFVNILLHTLSSLLIWRILLRFDIKAAWISAAAFAVHPICVQSVAWIAERKNVLSVFFYLASLFAFLCYEPIRPTVRGGSRKFYLLSVLLFLFSVLSKTAFCTLGPALLLFFWWIQGAINKRTVLLSLPYFAIALLAGSFTMWLEKNHVGAQGSYWQFSFIDRILIAGRAVWFYAKQIVFPAEPAFMYPRWTIDAGLWRQYLFPGGLLITLLLLWKLRNRIGRAPLCAVLFFIGTLMPALSFINFFWMKFSFVSDHLQYLPQTGVIVLVSSMIHSLLTRFSIRREIATAIWVAFFSLLMIQTWNHTGVFKDNLVLYDHTIEKNPNSSLAHCNRGLIYLNSGHSDEALQDFNRAVSLDARNEEAYLNRGHYYFQQKNYERALQDFNAILQFNPYFVDSYVNRGTVNFVRKNYDAAMQDFSIAIRLDPTFARAYASRGVVFSIAKQYDRALNDYNKAIDLDPFYGPSFINRSLNHRDMKQFDKALEDALKARELGVKVSPDYLQSLKIPPVP